MSIRSLVAAVLLALTLGGGNALAGAQPSVGIVKYNPQEQINDARAALRLAKSTLSDATARSKSLIAKADRTVDLKAKLKLLQEAADLLTKANKLRQQIADLEDSLERLGIAKEAYQNQVALEKKAAELAAQRAIELQQAEAQKTVAAALAAVPAKVEDRWSIDTLTPVGKEIVERVADAGWSSQQLNHVADNALYAVLANASYDRVAPPGWDILDGRFDTLSETGVSALAFRSEDKSNKEIVIAFRGSVTGTDWMVNAGLGLSVDTSKFAGGAVLGVINKLDVTGLKQLAADRFEESLAFAREVKRANPGSVITITGHSLGGGIAQYVAANLGLEAVAFDPAPIAALLDEVGKSDLKSYGRIENFRNGSDPLTAVDLGVIGGRPTTVNVTNDLRLSDVIDPRNAGILQSLIGVAIAAEVNHSSVGLAIAMSSVAFAKCYITPCP